MTITYNRRALDAVNAIDADALVGGILAAVERYSEAAAQARELEDAIAAVPAKTTPRLVAISAPRSTPARLAAATHRVHAADLLVVS